MQIIWGWRCLTFNLYGQVQKLSPLMWTCREQHILWEQRKGRKEQGGWSNNSRTNTLLNLHVPGSVKHWIYCNSFEKPYKEESMISSILEVTKLNHGQVQSLAQVTDSGFGPAPSLHLESELCCLLAGRGHGSTATRAVRTTPLRKQRPPSWSRLVLTRSRAETLTSVPHS